MGSGVGVVIRPEGARAGALAVAAEVARGDLVLDVRIRVEPGETLALLGPNGAGKSTVLGCIAGTIELDRGVIAVGERVLDDTIAGVHVPSDRRRVGVVFQDYLLFPHLTVLENVAFGRRAAGVGRAEARAAATEWIERLGILHLSGSRPGRLSGGQRQRVALARALAIDPDVLVLDEPLAALDVEVRDEVRAELAGFLRLFSGATIVVTHDLADAAALASRVTVLEHGLVTQRATVDQLRANPATPWVRRLVGR